MKLEPRTCKKCGRADITKAGGCLSFRYQDPRTKEWERGYFHPTCFRSFLKRSKPAP